MKSFTQALNQDDAVFQRLWLFLLLPSPHYTTTNDAIELKAINIIEPNLWIAQ